VTQRIRGFEPIADPSARVLILGSMPGRASLDAARYYAHPRNAFWPILGAAFGFPADAPWADRFIALKRNHIALWDVLTTCHRPGSLDSAITNAEANDFRGFFATHARIERVLFNGGTAEALFRRLVLPTIDVSAIDFVSLPSTSPAHAGMSPAKKSALWQAALGP